MKLGLIGLAQSGKDTVGNILSEEFGYKRLAFADKLKEALYILDPTIIDKEGNLSGVRDIVEDSGWEEAKKNLEIRRLLQVFGSEIGRDLFGKDFWINELKKEIDDQNFFTPEDTNYVITDCRFSNEVEFIKESWGGGYIIKVTRPGVARINNHQSENVDVLEFDYEIINDGTLEDLREQIARILGEINVLRRN